MIDRELLAANKRVVNLGLELMGARTLQRAAVETDARATCPPPPPTSAGRSGSAACGRRCGSGTRSSATAGPVNGPEKRDFSGRLIDG